MEGDGRVNLVICQKSISIHSLRMEGDAVVALTVVLCNPFQSTPSAWRETLPVSCRFHNAAYFNPLPPHGGRLQSFRRELERHTFQSTPSAWRETALRPEFAAAHFYFNPLPPHGGRPSARYMRYRHSAFQSTPSAWRETFVLYHGFQTFRKFQSTPSAWRETCCRSLRRRICRYFNPLPPHGGRL